MAPTRGLLALMFGLTLALAGCADSGSSDGGLVDVNFGGSDNSCHDCYDDDDWAAAAVFGSLLGFLLLVLIVVGIVAAIAGAAGGRGEAQQQQQVVVVQGNDVPRFDQNQRW